MEIKLSTTNKCECLDITSDIEEIVGKSGVKEGLCNIFVTHATAAIAINENADPNVLDDFIKALDKIVPEGIWKHDKVDNNAAAHIKAAIIGPSETIPIKDGKLFLGTWQSVWLVELDGPRHERSVQVTIIQNNR